MATFHFFFLSLSLSVFPQTTSIIYNDGFCERHLCFSLDYRCAALSFSFIFFSLHSLIFSHKMSVPTCILCAMPASQPTNQQYTKQHSTTETFSILARNYNFSACFRHVKGAARSCSDIYISWFANKRQHSIPNFDFGFSHFLVTTLKHFPLCCCYFFGNFIFSIKNICGMAPQTHTIKLKILIIYMKQWQKQQQQQRWRRLKDVLFQDMLMCVAYTIPWVGHLLKCWGGTIAIEAINVMCFKVYEVKIAANHRH